MLVGSSRGGTQVDLDGKREAWTALDALLRLAEPGAILVEEAAATFLARHFDLAPVDGVDAAGPVHRLVAAERPGVGRGRRPPTFVGRGRELGLLWSRLDDALRGHGQVVGLLGEAGIGKSRLLHEFRERLLGEPERRVTFLEGRCQSYASAIPYFPILDILRSNFRIAEGESPDVIAAKIRAGVQEVGIEPAGAIPYVLRLFGISEGTEALAALTTSAVKARTFEALRHLILSGARRRPIIFVVEDLHWIDSTSEECFTTLMDSAAGLPAMGIVTYRPGYRAPWMDRSYVTQVALPPLSREDSLRVVRSVRRADAVSDRVAEVILGKAEGNPFFLEELSRVVEGGAGESGPGLAVPDTIQEVLLARIDRLPDQPRRLLQTAAVVGQEVPLALLHAVWEGELDAHLRELMRLEFLHAKSGGGEPLYAFTHSLTRDVAYESLPSARRRALHGAIARALEAVYVDRLGEVYDRLAYHYGRTEEAAKAVLYLERLATKAVDAHAHAEAVRILEEARAHVDRLPPAEQDRRRLELALVQAYSLIPLGAFQDIVTLLLRHQAALEALNDPRLAGPYHFLLGRSYSLLGDQRQASHHLGLGLTEASRAEDGATQGLIHYVLAQHEAMSGRPREGLEHARQAVALLERAGESRWIGPAYWTVGMNCALLGHFDAALAAQAQATARGAEVGDPQIASSAAWASGLVHVCQGNLEAGIRSCEDALARSPDPLNTALALGWLGFAWLERGDLAASAARLEEAIRLLEQFRFRQPQAWFSAFLAEGHCRARRLETALELASRGLELARATGSMLGVGWATRALGHIAQARGALGDAHDHLREALRAFEAVGAEFEIARSWLDLGELAHARGDAERDGGPSGRGRPAVPRARRPALGGAGGGACPRLGPRDVSLSIAPLTVPDLEAERAALVALLQDAVESGASVGFLPPLGDAAAASYWATVAAGLGEGSRVVLAARDDELGLVGSAQLELAMRANARHRAEVSKVMVHRRARRRGVGRALMLALEDACPAARAHDLDPRHPAGRSLGGPLPGGGLDVRRRDPRVCPERHGRPRRDRALLQAPRSRALSGPPPAGATHRPRPSAGTAPVGAPRPLTRSSPAPHDAARRDVIRPFRREDAGPRPRRRPDRDRSQTRAGMARRGNAPRRLDADLSRRRRDLPP